MKLSKKQVKIFQRIHKRHHVSLNFLIGNTAKIVKLFKYAIGLHFIIKRKLCRKKNRVFIRYNVGKKSIPNNKKKLIKRVKKSKKRTQLPWTTRVVGYLKRKLALGRIVYDKIDSIENDKINNTAVINKSDPIENNLIMKNCMDDPLQTQLKKQLLLLKGGKRNLPEINSNAKVLDDDDDDDDDDSSNNNKQPTIRILGCTYNNSESNRWSMDRFSANCGGSARSSFDISLKDAQEAGPSNIQKPIRQEVLEYSSSDDEMFTEFLNFSNNVLKSRLTTGYSQSPTIYDFDKFDDYSFHNYAAMNNYSNSRANNTLTINDFYPDSMSYSPINTCIFPTVGLTSDSEIVPESATSFADLCLPDFSAITPLSSNTSTTIVNTTTSLNTNTSTTTVNSSSLNTITSTTTVNSSSLNTITSTTTVNDSSLITSTTTVNTSSRICVSPTLNINTTGEPVNETPFHQNDDNTNTITTSTPSLKKQKSCNFIDSLITKINSSSDKKLDDESMKIKSLSSTRTQCTELNTKSSTITVKAVNELITQNMKDGEDSLSSGEFLGFSDAEILPSNVPGMLPTPVVANKQKNKESAFVSEHLDKFMRDNLLDKNPVELITLPKLKRFEDGLVCEGAVPPKLAMAAMPYESASKPRTVAEKRIMMQKNKSTKYYMIENENTIYRELKKRSRDCKTNVALIKSIQKLKVPATRDFWKATSWLLTENGNFYFQIANIDGMDCKIISGFGNNSVKQLPKQFSGPTKENIQRFVTCSADCTDAKSFPFIRVRQNNQNKPQIDQKVPLVPPTNKEIVEFYKPGPLSSKCLLKSYEPHCGPSEIYTMPTIQLEVFPLLNRPLDEVVKGYLKMLLPADSITKEWAEFAVSTLVTPTNLELSGKFQSFTFDIPYLNKQNNILVRRMLNRKEKFEKITLKDLKFRKVADDSNDPIAIECANILSEMIDSVGIGLSEDSLIKNDPDIDYENNVKENLDTIKSEMKPLLGVSVPASAGTLKKSTNKRSTNQKTKLMSELKRLNATIIDAGGPSDEEVLVEKDCKKPYCLLGCVCLSLNGQPTLNRHCKKIGCIFECKCTGSFMQNDEKNSVITSQDALILRKKATARLAKMEREFCSTVVLTNNETLLINESQYERKRRCTKRYLNYTCDSDTDVNSVSDKSNDPPNKKARLSNKTKSPVTEAKLSSNANCVDVDEDIMKQMKHCTVDLCQLQYFDNIEPWCMVHCLYKCFCKGKDVTGKPFILQKDEDIEKEDNTAYSRKATYSFDTNETTNKDIKPEIKNKIVHSAPLKIIEKRKSSPVKPQNKNNSRFYLKRDTRERLLIKQKRFIANYFQHASDKCRRIIPIPYVYKSRNKIAVLSGKKQTAHRKFLENDRTNLILLTRIQNSALFQPKLAPLSDSTSNSSSIIINQENLDQSSLMQPSVMQPSVMQPSVMQPSVMQPSVMRPSVMQPSVMLIQPTFIHPSLMRPSVMQPTLMRPCLMQATLMKPSVMQPSVMQPSLMQPPLQNRVRQIDASSMMRPTLHYHNARRVDNPSSFLKISSVVSLSPSASVKETPLPPAVILKLPQMPIPKLPQQPSKSVEPDKNTANQNNRSTKESEKTNTINTQDVHNDVLKTLNFLVTKTMHNICNIQVDESKNIPNPIFETLHISQWCYFLQACVESIIHIWEVKEGGKTYFTATMQNVMPFIKSAVSVVNIKAIRTENLSLFGKMLNAKVINQQTSRLSVLMSGYLDYWRILGFTKSKIDYSRHGGVIKPTPDSHPWLSKKINALYEIMARKRIECLREKIAKMSQTTPSDKNATNATNNERRPSHNRLLKMNIKIRQLTEHDMMLEKFTIPSSANKEGDYRWLVLDIVDDFSHILFVPEMTCLTHNKIKLACEKSVLENKMIRLPQVNGKSVDCFIKKNDKGRIYLGPFSLNGNPAIVLYQNIDGNMMLREDFEMAHNIKRPVNTTGFWLCSKNGKLMFNASRSVEPTMQADEQRVPVQQRRPSFESEQHNPYGDSSSNCSYDSFLVSQNQNEQPEEQQRVDFSGAVSNNNLNHSGQNQVFNTIRPVEKTAKLFAIKTSNLNNNSWFSSNSKLLPNRAFELPNSRSKLLFNSGINEIFAVQTTTPSKKNHTETDQSKKTGGLIPLQPGNYELKLNQDNELEASQVEKPSYRKLFPSRTINLTNLNLNQSMPSAAPPPPSAATTSSSGFDELTLRKLKSIQSMNLLANSKFSPDMEGLCGKRINFNKVMIAKKSTATSKNSATAVPQYHNNKNMDNNYRTNIRTMPNIIKFNDNSSKTSEKPTLSNSPVNTNILNTTISLVPNGDTDHQPILTSLLNDSFRSNILNNSPTSSSNDESTPLAAANKVSSISSQPFFQKLEITPIKNKTTPQIPKIIRNEIQCTKISEADAMNSTKLCSSLWKSIKKPEKRKSDDFVKLPELPKTSVIEKAPVNTVTAGTIIRICRDDLNGTSFVKITSQPSETSVSNRSVSDLEEATKIFDLTRELDTGDVINEKETINSEEIGPETNGKDNLPSTNNKNITTSTEKHPVILQVNTETIHHPINGYFMSSIKEYPKYGGFQKDKKYYIKTNINTAFQLNNLVDVTRHLNSHVARCSTLYNPTYKNVTWKFVATNHKLKQVTSSVKNDPLRISNNDNKNEPAAIANKEIPNKLFGKYIGDCLKKTLQEQEELTKASCDVIIIDDEDDD